MHGWLAARRSQNTRTAYARDIGITPQPRASRTPSWLTWCQGEGWIRSPASPGWTWPGRSGSWRPLDCPRPARPAGSAPCWAGMPGWPGAGISPPARPPASPGPGPLRTPRLGRPQRARIAARVAFLLFTGARLSDVIGVGVADLGTRQGHRVLWVTRGNGRRQGLPLPSPAASRIDAYLAGRADLAGVPVLFATRTGGRLFAAGVRRVVRRLATRVGLPAGQASHLGPRDTALLRHAVARCRRPAPAKRRNRHRRHRAGGRS